MRYLFIDPGSSHTAIIVYDPDGKNKILGAEIIDRAKDEWPSCYRRRCCDALRFELYRNAGMLLCGCEMISHYGRGMPAGAEVFDTCILIGCLESAALGAGRSLDLIPRQKIKVHLCGSARSGDPEVRQALIDRFFGGPQETRKGGMLAGVKTHLWAALAGAVYMSEVQA